MSSRSTAWPFMMSSNDSPAANLFQDHRNHHPCSFDAKAAVTDFGIGAESSLPVHGVALRGQEEGRALVLNFMSSLRCRLDRGDCRIDDLDVGKVLDFQAVVVLAPLAAVLDRFGDLLDGEILKLVQPLRPEHRAEDLQSPLVADPLAQAGELVTGERLGLDVSEVALYRVPVLPELVPAGSVGEVFELAEGLGQHGGVVLLADDQIAEEVLLQQRRG